MTLVFYRAQSAGELLDVSLNVVKEHAGLLLRLAVWPIAGLAAIDLASRALPKDSTWVLLTLPVSFAVYSLGEAGVSFAAWQLLHGLSVDPSDVRARLRERLGSVLVGYTLKWTAVICGVVLLIVPGVLLLARWFAIPAASVIEDGGLRASFRRSGELAKGNRRTIFTTVVLLDVVATIGSITLTISMRNAATGVSPIWASILNWGVGLLYLVYHAVLSTALYGNARVRNEGYDVEMLVPTAARCCLTR